MPQAGIDVDVLAKFHEHGRQIVESMLWPYCGSVGPTALGFFQILPQILGDVWQVFIDPARGPRWPVGAKNFFDSNAHESRPSLRFRGF